MSYTLQGDAMNLDDIRRDMATLRALKAEAIKAQEVKVLPREGVNGDVNFDEFIGWDAFYDFAVKAGFSKSAATRLKTALYNLSSAPPKRQDGFYVGHLCHSSLWDAPSYSRPDKTGLAGLPNFGEVSMVLFQNWLVYLNIQNIRTPPDWKSPD